MFLSCERSNMVIHRNLGNLDVILELISTFLVLISRQWSYF
jgi:hypothetical protein